jgi:hypothetical protein
MSDTKPVLLALTIQDDFVQIENGRQIHRPQHISRSRWCAMWQHLEFQGLTEKSIARIATVMRGST